MQACYYYVLNTISALSYLSFDELKEHWSWYKFNFNLQGGIFIFGSLQWDTIKPVRRTL